MSKSECNRVSIQLWVTCLKSPHSQLLGWIWTTYSRGGNPETLQVVPVDTGTGAMNYKLWCQTQHECYSELTGKANPWLLPWPGHVSCLAPFHEGFWHAHQETVMPLMVENHHVFYSFSTWNELSLGRRK